MSTLTVPTIPELSRTEKNFYDLLCDGKPHSGEELAKHLWDELGVNLKSNVSVHICNIRKKLPAGYYITPTIISKKLHYLLVCELSRRANS